MGNTDHIGDKPISLGWESKHWEVLNTQVTQEGGANNLEAFKLVFRSDQAIELQLA